MKHIGLPLRAALTGTKPSPSITDIAVALGMRNEISFVINLQKLNFGLLFARRKFLNDVVFWGWHISFFWGLECQNKQK